MLGSIAHPTSIPTLNLAENITNITTSLVPDLNTTNLNTTNTTNPNEPQMLPASDRRYLWVLVIIVPLVAYLIFRDCWDCLQCHKKKPPKPPSSTGSSGSYYLPGSSQESNLSAGGGSGRSTSPVRSVAITIESGETGPGGLETIVEEEEPDDDLVDYASEPYYVSWDDEAYLSGDEDDPANESLLQIILDYWNGQ